MFQFDEGVLQLSNFDPLSNSYQTRVIRLPDPPSLESLEYLFCSALAAVPASPSTMLSQPRSTDETPLRSTKSFSAKKTRLSLIRKIPRRCKSNPHLPRLSDTDLRVSATPRKSRSKRSVSNAFQALTCLLQKKMRRHPWHSHTWLDEMQPSSLDRSPNMETENWWAASPPLSCAVIA